MELYRQLTHRYVPQYSHLDDCELVADVQIFSQLGTTYNDGSPDESFAQCHIAVIQLRHTLESTGDWAEDKHIEEALSDTHAVGCSCEHDCCGHWFGGISHFKWVSRDAVVFTVHLRRNY